MTKSNKRISIEDLWKIQRPASPALSPDGAQVCVAVTRYEMAENKATTHLWLLSSLAGESRELTRCGEKDGQPVWSPDGRHIAFVAKRGEGKDKDEEAQIYLISPDGGEARRLTNLATGVSGIKWFPNSSKIAFISWVWPDLKSGKAQAARYKEYKDTKVKAHVVEHTAYRYWDHWLSDGRVPQLHLVELKGARAGKSVNLFSGTPYELPVYDTDATEYDIAPDGKKIAFTFNPNEDKRADQDTHLIEMDIKSRKTKNLNPNANRAYHQPAYSPDGRWIACLANDLRRSINDSNKITLIDRASGKLHLAHPRWDRQVNAPLRWAQDSQSLYFTADEFARVNLWRLPLTANVPEKVIPGGCVSEFDIRAGLLAFIRNDMSSAPKVFVADVGGSNIRAVETFNDALMAKLHFGEVKEFTIKGWNNEPVQMWVIYPPGFDPRKKWPLIHNIHGGPHANWADNFHFRWNNHVFAAQGYVVVCVNYHGSLGWGQAFLESNNGAWGSKEHADIEAGTDFMLKQGYIDASRLAATGGSYGGKMVAWMNGRNGAKKDGDRYKAYVCHAGCYDWVGMYSDDAYYFHPYQLEAKYWEHPEKVAAQNPITFAKHMKTPTLVIHGALDYRVPDAQGLAYFNTLKSLNVPTRLVFFPDENHWILKPQNSRLWYKEYFAWLAKYVGSGASKKK